MYLEEDGGEDFSKYEEYIYKGNVGKPVRGAPRTNKCD